MDITVIIQRYLEGASLAQLSRETNISTYRLKKIFLTNGIKIRSKEEQNKYSPQNQRKYTINDNFFDEITPTAAYILGFLAADGSVQKNGDIKIGLSSVDKEFLEHLKLLLKSNYPIRDYQTKDGYNVSEFTFRSKKIKQRLSEFGIVNRKTYDFKFPKNLPQERWLDFIRGYFDGDGTFCLSGLYARASLCSYNENFLKDVIQILDEQYKIPPVKIYKQKDATLYYFQYSQNSAKRLYEIFYQNKPDFYLTRKYQKCIQLFGEIKPHEPVISQEEKKIV